MAAVPQKTLIWLYDVLKREYRDPNRAYSDLAQTLGRHPSLSPRTDVYTFENGTSALLVQLHGTVPVNFRGQPYQFPVALWYPHNFPFEAPFVYVKPTDDMLVRPGQHVAGDGRVYHHYLARWRDAWDRSSSTDFLSILADVFAKEPPVMARNQTPSAPNQSYPPSQAGPPLPPPPVPREPSRSTTRTSMASQSQQMPPRPPKEQEGAAMSVKNQSPVGSRPGRYDNAPPPPPPPPKPLQSPTRVPSGYEQSMYQDRSSQRPPSAQYMPQRQSSLRQSVPMPAPYPPPQQYPISPPMQVPPHPQQSAPLHIGVTSPSSQQRDGLPPQHPAPTAFGSAYQQSATGVGSASYANEPALHPNQAIPSQSQQPMFQPTSVQQFQGRPLSQQFHPQYQPSSQPPPQFSTSQTTAPVAALQKPKEQAPNLMDSPFEISLSNSNPSSNLQAPPIPRNPEKDALLSHLSHQLTQILHNHATQSSAALPALQSQHQAMNQTLQILSHEISSLQSLQSILNSNISHLRSALSKSDAVIQSARRRSSQGDIPKIDEMLTPPTVVARQLYDTICEERGIDASIWALQEGFVRGRIGADIWARRTRELAREGFRKKYLAKKIGKGMGLDERPSD